MSPNTHTDSLYYQYFKGWYELVSISKFHHWKSRKNQKYKICNVILITLTFVRSQFARREYLWTFLFLQLFLWDFVGSSLNCCRWQLTRYSTVRTLYCHGAAVMLYLCWCSPLCTYAKPRPNAFDPLVYRHVNTSYCNYWPQHQIEVHRTRAASGVMMDGWLVGRRKNKKIDRTW